VVAGDRVAVQVFVEVPIADAFAVFTEEIDQWWRRGPAYRLAKGKTGTMRLDPKLGGKLVEHYGDDRSRDIGTITVWEPPAHVVMEWRGYNFREGEVTTVELWFESSGEGTRVRLEHRGWSSLPADHPVRHGEPIDVFIRNIGMWWGSLLTAFREMSERR
jgi:uncharacterized protein YndB with AHSA1/START domain